MTMSDILLVTQPKVLLKSNESVSIENASAFQKLEDGSLLAFYEGVMPLQLSLLSILARDAFGMAQYKILKKAGIHMDQCLMLKKGHTPLYLATEQQPFELVNAPTPLSFMRSKQLDAIDYYRYHFLHLDGGLFEQADLDKFLRQLIIRAFRFHLPISVSVPEGLKPACLKPYASKLHMVLTSHLDCYTQLKAQLSCRVICFLEEGGALLYDDGNEVCVHGKRLSVFPEQTYGRLIAHYVECGSLLVALQRTCSQRQS